ncbi:MbnP family protein [Lewinella sp. LCG006]|uniref:MbnP family protein n=1 Tax=Lewinella sp. LCG006 TaxID=3231911 RepID=UPI003460F2F8
MRIVLFLLVVLCISGCYEPTPGCLDTRATNFDLDADEACPDCCTFPKLSIRFDNTWTYPDEMVSLRLDTFYIDANNHPFRIQRIRFYWSDLELQLSNGETLTITDSLDLSIANGTDTSMITVRDDYLFADIDRATRSVTLKTLAPSGELASLKATFGIKDPVNKAVTTSVSNSHPLAPKTGQMNLGAATGYIFAKIEYFQDTTAIDTVPRIINIYGSDFIRELQLDLPVPTTFIEGFNPVLVIENDISRWFSGIDVRQTDTTALKNQFVDNLTQSFQLTQVLAQ